MIATPHSITAADVERRWELALIRRAGHHGFTIVRLADGRYVVQRVGLVSQFAKDLDHLDELLAKEGA